MGHVSPPLAELTAQAQTMTAEGDLAGARAVLAGVLDPAETDPHRASPDLAVAAALHARILIALGDAHAARTWAGFAHAAEERLHGPRDERTIAAAATHAAVLHRVGNHGRAAQVYHDLVGELTALEGPLSPRVLAAEADLATAEHAAGHCTAARARLADAWTRYREAYGDASAPGIKMLARLGAMERECAHQAEGNEHLALAQELCARHLPADHSLAQQVARLAGAAPTGRHACGRVQRSTGPTPDPAGPPGPANPGGPASLGGPASPAGPASPGGPAGSGGPGSLAGPGISRMPATAPGVHPVLPDPPGPAEPVGRHAGPASPIPLPLEYPVQEPAAAPAPGPAWEGWQEPEPPARPGTPPAEWPAHGYVAQALAAQEKAPPGPFPPDSYPPVPTSPTAYPPGPQLPVDRAPDRLLPVPVERPDEPSAQQPFILATVLVAGVAAAAAIVAVTLPRGDRAGSPAAPPAAAPSAAAAPAPPTTTAPSQPTQGQAAPAPTATVDPIAPVDVRLRDNRDSVSLTWRYPKGSEGPVLISGGRVGQEQRAFQQLPAGTTDYVVYGLNERTNYCFSVAVVYTVDKVAASQPVCTDRR